MSGNVNFNSIAQAGKITAEAANVAISKLETESPAIINAQKQEPDYNKLDHAQDSPLTPEQAQAKQTAHQKAIDEISAMKAQVENNTIITNTVVPGTTEASFNEETGLWEYHEITGTTTTTTTTTTINEDPFSVTSKMDEFDGIEGALSAKPLAHNEKTVDFHAEDTTIITNKVTSGRTESIFNEETGLWEYHETTGTTTTTTTTTTTIKDDLFSATAKKEASLAEVSKAASDAAKIALEKLNKEE